MDKKGRSIAGRIYTDVKHALSLSLSLAATTAAYLGNSAEDTLCKATRHTQQEQSRLIYVCLFIDSEFPIGHAPACVSPHTCGPARFEKDAFLIIQYSSIHEVSIFVY